MTIEAKLDRLIEIGESLLARTPLPPYPAPGVPAQSVATGYVPVPPPPPNKPAKAPKAAKSVPAPEPVSESSFLDEPEQAEPVKEVTVEDVRAAAVVLGKAIGQDPVLKLLGQLDASPLTGKMKAADNAKRAAVLKVLQDTMPKAA